MLQVTLRLSAYQMLRPVEQIGPKQSQFAVNLNRPAPGVAQPAGAARSRTAILLDFGR